MSIWHHRLRTSRRPKNKAEGLLFDALVEDGWTVTKRGWPDFFCMKDGQLKVVEVKPDHESLKRDQYVVLRALAQYGIPCYMWTSDAGYERVVGSGRTHQTGE